jgi:hypothetical protein
MRGRASWGRFCRCFYIPANKIIFVTGSEQVLPVHASMVLKFIPFTLHRALSFTDSLFITRRSTYILLRKLPLESANWYCTLSVIIVLRNNMYT